MLTRSKMWSMALSRSDMNQNLPPSDGSRWLLSEIYLEVLHSCK
jgi:hypothetical protein